MNHFHSHAPPSHPRLTYSILPIALKSLSLECAASHLLSLLSQSHHVHSRLNHLPCSLTHVHSRLNHLPCSLTHVHSCLNHLPCSLTRVHSRLIACLTLSPALLSQPHALPPHPRALLSHPPALLSHPVAIISHSRALLSHSPVLLPQPRALPPEPGLFYCLRAPIVRPTVPTNILLSSEKGLCSLHHIF